MSKTITSEIVVAYSQCPRKAFLLMCTETPGTPHEYIKILERQRQDNQRKYLDILQKKNPDVQPYSQDALKAGSDFLINARLEANGLAADCAILSKVKIHSKLGRYSYEPTIFVGTHSIKEEQKLELFFVAHILQQIQNKRPSSGRIIGLNEKSYNVKLENSSKTLIPLIEPLQEWTAASSPEAPLLILNKHCPICQFQSLCRAKAEQEDNLSLLDGISTPKTINKYEKKGLFTVKQLSYTFKPRKRKKRTKNPPPITHKPELQALAIREGKIYLEELPKLTRQPVELFLDIEGVPDRHFYYLIGLLVSEDDITTYHPFWADSSEDEAQMWQQFLEKVNQYLEVPIYHYGSFEPRSINTLAKRYDIDCDILIKRLVNINKHIFGKIYFPVYSNRLKDIGLFIGATWASTHASGLQSLIWRYHWEETRQDNYKISLLTYNSDDCRALKHLIDALSAIKQKANILSQIDFADRPKRQVTELSQEVHGQFEMMLKFAHTHYDERKIRFRGNKEFNEQNNHSNKVKAQSSRKKIPRKLTRIIRLPLNDNCPNCECEPLQKTQLMAKKLVIDLIFTKNGVKKSVIQYRATKGYCRKCQRYYHSPLNTRGRADFYGHAFKVWITYQRVGFRMSYQSISQITEGLFGENLDRRFMIRAIQDMALYYSETEDKLAQQLRESPFVHADETKINIRGIDWYVWVFTNGKHVVFKLSDSRETKIVHEFLSNYEGILISDFYHGYDSIKCKQQKCWVHLIRDLNNDLWKSPFDTEFEQFILEVRNLIIPIMEAVQKYGLKKRHLSKFQKQVERFYIKLIIDQNYKSDLVTKYQKRFIKHRENLFTFLEQDGIPWHNNTAENTIRYLALQRNISESFHESGARNYLVLLGVKETCRFQGISLLEFLLSGETDLNKFEAHKNK